MEEINMESKQYPSLLKEIAKPPAILYYRGNVTLMNTTPCIAIVGTRRATSYGRAVVNSLIPDLCAAGITIVSGLAYGIDSYAHRAALGAGGKTIAVVPGGVDRLSIYPRGHAQLADIISTQGCIISESKPAASIHKYSFLARNRIIAGVSLGVVIIECMNRSGALITARYARDENRSVYAIPGSIFSTGSLGPHSLLREGALPVTSAADILNDLSLPLPLPPRTTHLTADEQEVLQYIQSNPQSPEQLVELTRFSPARILTALGALTLKNIITRNTNGTYHCINTSLL